MSVLIRENRDNYWMLNWLDKFMDGHKGFICGGCFKNIFNQEKVKDLDIFFQNEGDREEAEAELKKLRGEDNADT